MIVRDIMSGTIYSVARAATVADAVAELKSRNIGALVVSDDGRSIDGVISERDVVRALLSAGTDILSHPVETYMTRNVFTCTPEETLVGAMALMIEKHIRHLPVVEERRLVGVISLGDAVKRRLRELEYDVEAMHRYIGGVG